MKTGRYTLLAALCTLVCSASVSAAEAVSFTKGLASTTNDGLIDCGRGSRVSAVGEISSDDGKIWTVPSATHFLDGPVATDLYNDCGTAQLASIDELDLNSVPLADAGGSEEFTAYIFADNYFELFVNGKLIAIDAVPFTPFNSSVVRFKADLPLTVAIKVVDWEESLGIGTEKGRGSNFQTGDGGLVAVFKNASGETVAITDNSWAALPVYISPLTDTSCLQVADYKRDSTACSTDSLSSAQSASAAHWAEPGNWTDSSYDASVWPASAEFDNDTVGVDNKKGYTNFTDVFDATNNDAVFIWSDNLILDNVVLFRKTIE